ncbi:MAG: tetratricopeptide repeat protein, partial [Candidatus Omnitrophica bacterium]|nr:tetratricopeptide repeat protein [Candidatus Omnitrophota bacterium]
LIFWVNISFAGGLYRKLKGEKPVKVNYSLLKIYLVLFTLVGSIVSIMGIKASRSIYIAKHTKGNISLQFAERAVLYNPFSFKYMHFAGTVAMNLDEYQKAYKLLTKAVNLHPYYDSIHNNLGMTYFITGDFKKAEESFLTALKLNPDSYEFNNNIGFLYLHSERFDEAIKYLQKATQLKKDAFLSFYSLGVAYYMKTQYDRAKEQFRKALEINPSFYPAKEYLEKIPH